MKILVCTDGSDHSQKALEQASVIARGCNVTELAIIHVFDQRQDTHFPFTEGGITPEQIGTLKKLIEEQKKERKKILTEALKYFEEKNIKARIIFKEGNSSNTIVEVAHKEGFDMIVLGSRGFGGLKKVLLGSVSNAIIQEVENCSVLTVK